MKLSEILGRILTDVELRTNRTGGVCDMVAELSDHSLRIYEQFVEARRACKQTDSYVYPVLHPDYGREVHRSSTAYVSAARPKSMWRGEYGVNRRKLVRDCWRWAKERGL